MTSSATKMQNPNLGIAYRCPMPHLSCKGLGPGVLGIDEHRPSHRLDLPSQDTDRALGPPLQGEAMMFTAIVLGPKVIHGRCQPMDLRRRPTPEIIL